MEEEKEDFTQGVALLNAYLSNAIANYRGVNFLALTRDQWRAKTDGVYNYPEKDYGAFQNSLYPTKEKAAYVHNRFYVKRILFDSIDWLDNAVFNGTITSQRHDISEGGSMVRSTCRYNRQLYCQEALKTQRGGLCKPTPPNLFTRIHAPKGFSLGRL